MKCFKKKRNKAKLESDFQTFYVETLLVTYFTTENKSKVSLLAQPLFINISE